MSQPGASAADLKLAFALLATLRGMPQIIPAMKSRCAAAAIRKTATIFLGDFRAIRRALSLLQDERRNRPWFMTGLRRFLDFGSITRLLRRENDQDVFVDESAFVFVRTPDLKKGCAAGGGEHYLIAVNASDQAREVTIHTQRHGSRWLRGSYGAGDWTVGGLTHE